MFEKLKFGTHSPLRNDAIPTSSYIHLYVSLIFALDFGPNASVSGEKRKI
jgi:hypothetical protein